MMVATMVVMASAPAGAQGPDDGNGAINLVCTGRGEKLQSGYVNTLEWDRYDHRYRSRSGVQSEMRGFESAVTLQIYDNDGRIRLPQKLIPPLNSGGDHQHWWQLDNISVGNDEIRASYRLNGLNKPKVRIDRQTGVITIKGTGQDFSGTCERIDPGQRRF
ncbi:hypothetical protein [Sphingomonas montana]|uniref:hypothetical protein n=1 Tax=Sphingomonas montana TaxID=1843236 RepID=UPI00096CA3CA|nr:hypothetical protein [Sphingomonas montana]